MHRLPSWRGKNIFAVRGESRRKYWLADLRLVFVWGWGASPFFARVRRTRAIAESRINYGNDDATFSLTGSPSCISPPALCSCFWSPRKSGCTVCRVNRRSAHDCRSAARRSDPYLEYREREREKERGLIQFFFHPCLFSNTDDRVDMNGGKGVQQGGEEMSLLERGKEKKKENFPLRIRSVYQSFEYSSIFISLNLYTLRKIWRRRKKEFNEYYFKY